MWLLDSSGADGLLGTVKSSPSARINLTLLELLEVLVLLEVEG